MHPWDVLLLGPYTLPPRDGMGTVKVKCHSSVHIDKKAAESKDKGTTVIKGCPPFEVDVLYEYLFEHHDALVEPFLKAIDPSIGRMPMGVYHPDLVRRNLRRVVVEKISDVEPEPGGRGMARVTIHLVEWVPPPPKGTGKSKKQFLIAATSNVAVKPYNALEIVQTGQALVNVGGKITNNILANASWLPGNSGGAFAKTGSAAP